MVNGNMLDEVGMKFETKAESASSLTSSENQTGKPRIFPFHNTEQSWFIKHLRHMLKACLIEFTNQNLHQ